MKNYIARIDTLSNDFKAELLFRNCPSRVANIVAGGGLLGPARDKRIAYSANVNLTSM